MKLFLFSLWLVLFFLGMYLSLNNEITLGLISMGLSQVPGGYFVTLRLRQCNGY